MKKLISFLLGLLCLTGCQPKPVPSITDLLSKVWQAQTVKEGDQLVYTKGAPNNIRPSYTNFRLDLSQPGKAGLKDLDGRQLIGTWSISTDNQRLILDNLVPKPTSTNGTIEYYILPTPNGTSLSLERTAESRKTGNSVNQYGLIPE